MFTFIKKVIKTGTATSSYPLEPIAVDKNFRGKPEQNPQPVSYTHLRQESWFRHKKMRQF